MGTHHLWSTKSREETAWKGSALRSFIINSLTYVSLLGTTFTFSYRARSLLIAYLSLYLSLLEIFSRISLVAQISSRSVVSVQSVKDCLFLSQPNLSGPGLLSLSPVISCKGPFSSSLPCSVSVALPQIHKSLSLILFNLIGSPPVCPLVSRSCILCGVSTNSRHRCQQGPRILSSLGCIHRIPHKTAL